MCKFKKSKDDIRTPTHFNNNDIPKYPSVKPVSSKNRKAKKVKTAKKAKITYDYLFFNKCV